MGSVLFPQGVSSIEDVPADLALAIDHGFKILSWQENLQEEEMPPKWMWHLDWELEKWFEEVEIARKSKYNSNPDDNLEEVPMMANEDPELAERFGK
jgi:hypothetical protein